eukprot:PhM_4_TR13595/c1_g1_i1/m.63688
MSVSLPSPLPFFLLAAQQVQHLNTHVGVFILERATVRLLLEFGLKERVRVSQLAAQRPLLLLRQTERDRHEARREAVLKHRLNKHAQRLHVHVRLEDLAEACREQTHQLGPQVISRVLQPLRLERRHAVRRRRLAHDPLALAALLFVVLKELFEEHDVDEGEVLVLDDNGGGAGDDEFDLAERPVRAHPFVDTASGHNDVERREVLRVQRVLVAVRVAVEVADLLANGLHRQVAVLLALRLRELLLGLGVVEQLEADLVLVGLGLARDAVDDGLCGVAEVVALVIPLEVGNVLLAREVSTHFGELLTAGARNVLEELEDLARGGLELWVDADEVVAGVHQRVQGTDFQRRNLKLGEARLAGEFDAVAE